MHTLKEPHCLIDSARLFFTILACTILIRIFLLETRFCAETEKIPSENANTWQLCHHAEKLKQ